VQDYLHHPGFVLGEASAQPNPSLEQTRDAR